MSPSTITLDLTPDFDPATRPSKQSHFQSHPRQNGSTTAPPGGRTLLLAPPSVAAHEERLRSVFATFDRSTTDLQMLDRLSAGLVTLPPATYDLVLILTGVDGGRHAEASRLLATRDVFSRLVPSIRPGGRLRSEDGSLGGGGAETREAVLAGLVAAADGGFTKPEYAEEVVPLRFGAKKKNGTATPAAAAAPQRSSAGPPVGSVTVDVGGKSHTLDMVPPAAKPAGVGFVDFSDDFDMDDYDEDDDDDDDLIDEDTLLGLDDLKRPIQQPPECQPKPGQKRRSCKNCTCGLSERLEAKDKARREKADKDLKTLKLASDDLNEMDFTVKGTTGSCGSCSLGDAFRCADCPYIGLPPFNPGDKVEILNNIAQL